MPLEKITKPDEVTFLEVWFNWIKYKLTNSSPLEILLLLSIGIAAWAIFAPDSFQRARVAVIGLTTGWWRWGRKETVKRRFENTIIDNSKQINSEVGFELFNLKPSIQWVKESTREAFIKDKKVVVRLSYQDDQNKTLALATFD